MVGFKSLPNFFLHFFFPRQFFIFKFALFHAWKGALQEVLKIFEVAYCRICLLPREVSRQEKYCEKKQKVLMTEHKVRHTGNNSACSYSCLLIPLTLVKLNSTCGKIITVTLHFMATAMC